MSGSIYLGRGGRQLGPFDWAQIAAMVSSGQVLRGDIAWHEGMDDWQPAERVLERLGLSLVATPQPVPPPKLRQRW
jgi:hypothetical protein